MLGAHVARMCYTALGLGPDGRCDEKRSPRRPTQDLEPKHFAVVTATPNYAQAADTTKQHPAGRRPARPIHGPPRPA